MYAGLLRGLRARLGGIAAAGAAAGLLAPAPSRASVANSEPSPWDRPASGSTLPTFTRAEIAAWRDMTAAEQRDLLDQLRQRRQEATGVRRRPTRRRA